MRTLTRTAAGVAASVFLAFSAQAATLTIVADQATYNVGDTITLTITGDAEAGAASAIFGTVSYDQVLTSVTSQSQTQLTSFAGNLPWTNGVLQLDNPNPGTADAFNALFGTGTGTPDQLAVSVITLTADAAGTANFSWLTNAGAESLDFFGLTNAAGASVLIVPEPTTAALLGMGLLGLAVAGRRR